MEDQVGERRDVQRGREEDRRVECHTQPRGSRLGRREGRQCGRLHSQAVGLKSLEGVVLVEGWEAVPCLWEVCAV